ncbi:MAG: hydroxymethylglutaryl-CoA reductase, degradative [Candidatus Paceibacterota bacterium]
MSTELSQNGREPPFKSIGREGRHEFLSTHTPLDENDIATLRNSSILTHEQADRMVENAVGEVELPLGIAPYFVINGREYVVPMAIEESSVIAAASKMANLLRNNGEITAETLGQENMGQLLLQRPCDVDRILAVVEQQKEALISHANSGVGRSMCERGGGVTDIRVRPVNSTHPDDLDGQGTSVDVFVDTCDAMGANIITQICESLREPIEQLTRESVLMCIVSNYSDRRLFQARIRLHDIDSRRAERIQQGWWYADNDPHRAATHNKGIMNAVDAILVATGNDWRAAEAAAHTHACRTGRSRSLSTWRHTANTLEGKLEIPLPVGVVGGITHMHPTAVTTRKLADIHSAGELGQIATAVGLAQNLAALLALTGEGLTHGHMKLHISNLLAQCDTSADEEPVVRAHLEHELAGGGQISASTVERVLHEMRNGHSV